VLAGLESASGFIKRELSKRLHLKKIPNLRFEFDSSLNEGWKIERLLKEVKGE
jgi:ribosome-binding factor A